MDVDRDARNQIMDPVDHVHEFGRRTEACKMELWGWTQDALRTSEVHQLVSQVEVLMWAVLVQFSHEMHQYVDSVVVVVVVEIIKLYLVQTGRFLASTGYVAPSSNHVQKMRCSKDQNVCQRIVSARKKHTHPKIARCHDVCSVKSNIVTD